MDNRSFLALTKLDTMLKQKGMMAITLFRDVNYNTSYGERREAARAGRSFVAGEADGDDLLDAREFAGILEKAGISLAPADVRAIIHAIDQDGNGASESERAASESERDNAVVRELGARAVSGYTTTALRPPFSLLSLPLSLSLAHLKTAQASSTCASSRRRCARRTTRA